MQRRALLGMLGLPTDYYLTLTRPLPSTLLAATTVCLMPDAQAYQLLHASPSTALQQTQAAEVIASSASLSLPVSASLAANKEAKKYESTFSRVPGTVEVRAAPRHQEQGGFPSMSPSCKILVLSRFHFYLQPSRSFKVFGSTPCLVNAGSSTDNERPAVPGRQLECSFLLRLKSLKAVRQQLRKKLADIQGGSPEADLALAAKEAPGCSTYMALVSNHYVNHSRSRIVHILVASKHAPASVMGSSC